MRQVVEQLADYIVRVVQSDKKVIWLRQVVLAGIRHHQHLRLFQCASQIEIVEVFVIGEEADTDAISTRQSAFFDYTFDR